MSTIHVHSNPLVKELAAHCRATGQSFKSVQERAGLWDNAITSWLNRASPSLNNFIAACNAAGLELVLIEKPQSRQEQEP